jgi:hypothetical protein
MAEAHFCYFQVHSRAFPEKSLLSRLTFSNCSLSTVAEKSILSAISLLEIRNSTLASLSEEAIFSHVAKVSQDDAATKGRKDNLPDDITFCRKKSGCRDKLYFRY